METLKMASSNPRTAARQMVHARIKAKSGATPPKARKPTPAVVSVGEAADALVTPEVVAEIVAPVKSSANETVTAMRLRYDQGDVTMAEVATLFSRSLKTTKRALHREKGASEYSTPLWLIRKAEKAAQARSQTA
jgi:hypothetical protein